jgi:predicted nucleic acid-binding protein
VPNRIFIDTLFVIALMNRRDQYHQQALDLAEQFEGDPLLVTDAILLEIGNALARSYKQKAGRGPASRRSRLQAYRSQRGVHCQWRESLRSWRRYRASCV